MADIIQHSAWWHNCRRLHYVSSLNWSINLYSCNADVKLSRYILFEAFDKVVFCKIYYGQYYHNKSEIYAIKESVPLFDVISET